MIFAGRKARRYARALYAVASDQGRQAELVAELSGVRTLFDSLPQLVQVLEHKHIPLDRKLDLLAKATPIAEAVEGEAAPAAGGSSLGRDFLTLLVRNGRVALLGEIVQALQDMLDLEQGVLRARVTTAVPLLRSEKDMIAEKLRSHTGANRVDVETRVSKRVIAGVLIHLGDNVIDATVRTYLDTMRERLKQVKVGEFADRGFLELGSGGSLSGAGE